MVCTSLRSTIIYTYFKNTNHETQEFLFYFQRFSWHDNAPKVYFLALHYFNNGKYLVKLKTYKDFNAKFKMTPLCLDTVNVALFVN